MSATAVIKLSMPPLPPICDNKESYVPSSEELIQCISQSARVDLFSINQLLLSSSPQSNTPGCIAPSRHPAKMDCEPFLAF